MPPTKPSGPDPFTDSVWVRPPRGAGEEPTLSREQIVRAAIELLDAEGAAGLSMRRLGTKLGAGTTSVYWYVANKEELFELAVDAVMAEVYVPEPGDTGWRIGASVFVTSMRAMLLRHPWVIGRLGVRPNLGPNAMRIGDRSVALLEAAGFSGMELSHASSLLTGYAIGTATTVAAVVTSTRQAGVPVDEAVERLKPYLERIAADYPNYERWWRETQGARSPAEQIGDEGFAFGLDRILDGLEQWLTRGGPPQP